MDKKYKIKIVPKEEIIRIIKLARAGLITAPYPEDYDYEANGGQMYKFDDTSDVEYDEDRKILIQFHPKMFEFCGNEYIAVKNDYNDAYYIIRKGAPDVKWMFTDTMIETVEEIS